MKNFAFLLFILAFQFASLHAFAASELEIVNWLKPLMGTHALTGTGGCDQISFDNVTSRWDRFAVIHFTVGPAGDFVYSPADRADQNCRLSPMNQGLSVLDCAFATRSGPLGQTLTKSRVQLIKSENNALKALRFERRVTPDPAGNYSASCN